MSENNFNILHARVTFRNIPLHKLERYSFKEIKTAYESFMKISDVSECVIVQSPFRVEVFLIVNLESDDSPDARRTEGKQLTIKQIEDTWASLTELDEWELDHLDQTLEVYKNTDVYKNLLRLACGLESLILGRPDVLDELKTALSTASEYKGSGKVLNKLFDNSIRIASRIRDSTGFSNKVVSLGDRTVKIAQENAGLDAKKKILIIGTGETAAMVAESLNKKDLKFDVSSRTIDRATGFSKSLSGNPVEFDKILSEFNKYDIVFVATTADYFIIKHNSIKRAMENKKTGTMILDISEPRAVDDSIYKFPGIKIMFRDQILEMIEENLIATKSKVPEVEKLIDKEVPVLEATIKRLEPQTIA